MFIRVEGDGTTTYPFSTAMLKRANPQVSFPEQIPEATLAQYGVFPVEPTPRPSGIGRLSYVEGQPEFVDGSWEQTWTPVEVTIDQWRSRLRVTSRQFKLALEAMGLFDTINAAMLAADRTTQIFWAEANEFERSHPLIAAFAAQLGFTDEQVDDLFVQAGAIP